MEATEKVTLYGFGKFLEESGYERIKPKSFAEKPTYKKDKNIVIVCVPCRWINVNGVMIKPDSMSSINLEQFTKNLKTT